MQQVDQRKQLRRAARGARRQLTVRQQRTASYYLTRQLLRHSALLRSHDIALYIPNDGEIDPTPLIKVLRQRGKQCYLPVLRPFINKLWFAPLTLGSKMKPNRFGIPEPDVAPSQMRNAQSLNVILMPLVAFDRHGGRLGMGGGFYDRTLAFKTRQSAPTSPRLIGLAHECQEVEQIPMESWDIPLDAIATDKRVIDCKSPTP